MAPTRFEYRGTVPLLRRMAAEVSPQLGYLEAGGNRDFPAWQRKARRKLKDLLGFVPPTVTEPRAWKLEEEQAEGFLREHWALESPWGDHVFLYRLVPEAAPRAVILAWHGHGAYSSDLVAGVMLGREGEQEELEYYNYDYGAQFARRGYLVYVPCQRGFNYRGQEGNRCIDINQRAILLGTSGIGLRTQEGMHLVDWIKSRPEERRLPLGSVGLSGGGHITQFLAAVDPRVDAAINEGYFCWWKDQIVDVTHCACNYVPGLLRWFEMPDVAALICPRPLLVTTATEDDVAPVKSFRSAYRKLKAIYREQGAEKNLEQHVFEGHHEFSGDKAFPFFAKHLKA